MIFKRLERFAKSCILKMKKFRGENWKEIRLDILKRDNFKCQLCGEKNKRLDVHHIIPYSETQDNSLYNLITLCKRCHIIHERGYSRLMIYDEDIAITHVPKIIQEQFFELAEKDLKLRGPGDVYGTSQWGLPDLAMANLNNLPLIEKTRQAAKELLEKDPSLEQFPLLLQKLKNLQHGALV